MIGIICYVGQKTSGFPLASAIPLPSIFLVSLVNYSQSRVKVLKCHHFLFHIYEKDIYLTSLCLKTFVIKLIYCQGTAKAR